MKRLAKYDKKRIGELIDGTLEFYQLKEMMTSHKDPERFEIYREVLQDRVSGDDPILLPYGLHLYIVQKANGDRIANVTAAMNSVIIEKTGSFKRKSLLEIRGENE